MTYQPPHISRLAVEHPAAGESAFAVAPRSIKDLSAVLRHVSERSLTVQVVGGGTHSGYGDPTPPDIVMSMENLAEIEAWEPDDLTIVVGAGAPIADVEAKLNEANQSLGMPEHPGRSSVGGTISSGVSSLRRARLYSTRERVLEATVVTGDGRIVRSGGRVVKNVSGYDLHRLVVGAFGSMGVIVSVCLRLWPTPPGAMTVTLDDPGTVARVTRPLAVLEVDGVFRVFLAGTDEEVRSQAKRLGGSAISTHEWPTDPEGSWSWSLRVPPAMVAGAVRQLPAEWSYLAIHGVGDIRCAADSSDGAGSVRGWAESVGGSLVTTHGDPRAFDPWGAPPAGLDLQRRLIAEFDPARVINPGRLPGGL